MRALFTGLVILAASPAYAEITCPPSIDVAPQQLAKDVPGKQVFVDKVNTSYQLEGITLYNGKPEELGSLVPDKNGKTAAEWTLYDNGKQSYYLACRYTNTSLQLMQQLPTTLKTCRVTYAKDMHNEDGTPSPGKVSCK